MVTWHLGLVLSPVEYVLISNVPYVRPAHQGALIIPHGTAHHDAVRLREEFQENIRLFRETIQVEKALIKQIVASIDPEYHKELRDDATSTITLDIPAILQHLFLHYGQVDSDVLDREEQKLKNYMWNINDPPVQFFNLDCLNFPLEPICKNWNSKLWVLAWVLYVELVTLKRD